MTTAAVCACLLEEAVGRVGVSPDRLPEAHFAKQARFLQGVWAIASGADFVWPTTKGDRPPGAGVLRPYLRLLGESAHCDPEVLRKVIGVFHRIEDPDAIASPGAVAAVVKSTISRRLRWGLRAPSIGRGTLPPERPATAWRA